MNKLPLPIIDNSSIPDAGGLQHHQVRRLNVATRRFTTTEHYQLV
jgi:hypothetical protein